MPTPTYMPLANVTVTGSPSTITFSSISQSYRDLILVYRGTTPFVNLRFNNDSGTNYNYIEMRGSGTSASGQAFSNQTKILLDQAASGQWAIANIMDYSATNKNKTVLNQAGNDGASGSAAQTWRNTGAISTITIITDNGTFVAGSSFSLYGIGA